MHHAVENMSDNTETAKCRTQFAAAAFSTCLNETKRPHCNYAFLVCDGYICTHPDHRDFS